MSQAATDLDRSGALLEEMGFEFAPGLLAELAERAVREKLPQLGLLDLVLAAERERREERRIKTSLKLSGLPVGKTLEGFDYLFQRSVDRARVELLSTCEFARRHENVLLLGPPGVGKSHLAAGLGVKAVQNGFSVTFVTTDDLIAQLCRDEDAGRSIYRRRALSSAVLVLDELGFQALDRREAHLLLPLRAQLDDHHLQQGRARLAGAAGWRRGAGHRHPRSPAPPLPRPPDRRPELPPAADGAEDGMSTREGHHGPG